MTIKELEEALGMTRANIRFYEQEGLLSPARGENGYRDYSQADVETLQKIKLLRRLQVDLETIRKLQSGEVALPSALAKQLEALGRDQAALDRAREVCARLERAGTDYAGLDPVPWLEELDRAPASERFAPPRDELPPPPAHPWRRFLARQLDLALYGLPCTVLWKLVFHIPSHIYTNGLFQALSGYLPLGLMLLLEPLFLSHWGATPGKFVFGITVRDFEGRFLTLSDARRRTWEVFRYGMGYGIPGYRFYRQYKSYETCNNRDRLEWELTPGADCRPEKMTVPESTPRCFAWTGCWAVILALGVFIVLQSMIPPNRGELTLAEFCENWNFYNTQLDIGYQALTDQGVKEYDPSTFNIDPFFLSSYSHWSQVTENGEPGFRYTHTATGSTFSTFSFNGPMSLGLLAYAGSLPGMNGLTFHPDQWLVQLPEQQWAYDLTYRGVHITQTAHFTDGRAIDPHNYFFSLPEGETATLVVEFTVRTAEKG